MPLTLLALRTVVIVRIIATGHTLPSRQPGGKLYSAAALKVTSGTCRITISLDRAYQVVTFCYLGVGVAEAH